MRIISSSSSSIFSSNRAFFDIGASQPRIFSRAFSTESLLISSHVEQRHNLASDRHWDFSAVTEGQRAISALI
jgi:hypothetical protein